MMAKASPNGTFVRFATGFGSPRSGRPAGPKPLSRAWMVTVCSRLAVTSVHHSCQAMNRNRNRPTVMNTSPRVRTPQRNPFIAFPSWLDLRVQQAQASGVCREDRLVQGFHVVAQSEQLDILAIDLDLLTLVQRPAQGRGTTDGLDDVGRGVDPAVQDQRVAHATHGTGGDDPLVHQHHRLGTPRPQGVDHTLDVLLVDDDVVR